MMLLLQRNQFANYFTPQFETVKIFSPDNEIFTGRSRPSKYFPALIIFYEDIVTDEQQLGEIWAAGDWGTF